MSAHLTETQLEILRTLVKLYQEKKRMIKSKEVAEYLKKDEGTVRNIIMWLRGMGLVESRTGPSGGYRPTLKAYEVLQAGALTREYGYGEATIISGTRRITIPIYRLELLDVLSGSGLMAIAKTSGPLLAPVGSKVRIASRPVERVILEGEIKQVQSEAGEILVKVEKLVVIPDAKVGDIARRRLITLRSDMSVREAASVLTKHGIRGAPVNDSEGRIVGFITSSDIARLVAEGANLDEPVSRYMRHHVFSISENESIVEAMRLMDFHGVGRLLVINSKGKPVGIVTRTDILRYIVSLQRPL
ncbi:MAG: CBS domain-containing protein [Desulfurococcales archaeon]|nr:CBS domain-containing protein [Desulfurococcales archaeon]